MIDPIVVVAVGMVSPVGLSAAETSASVRARTSRFDSIALRDRAAEPFTVAKVTDDAAPTLEQTKNIDPSLTRRMRRMLQLGERAVRECLLPLAPSDMQASIPLCLALSERETRQQFDAKDFASRLTAKIGRPLDARQVDASHKGRAGGLAAIGQAAACIQSGIADFAIAGGVDTYIDPYVLATLDHEGRIKSSVNLDGFVPGEGASFLLLARASAARVRAMKLLAQVSAPAMGFEPGHLNSVQPYRGDGLASTLQALMADGTKPHPIAEVFSSMNGESYWAKEWGVARSRHAQWFQSSQQMHHPADCYGDTGAACGLLLTGLAALGMNAGFRRSPALIYASSDRGARAALIVSGIGDS